MFFSVAVSCGNEVTRFRRRTSTTFKPVAAATASISLTGSPRGQFAGRTQRRRWSGTGWGQRVGDGVGVGRREAHGRALSAALGAERGQRRASSSTSGWSGTEDRVEHLMAPTPGLVAPTFDAGAILAVGIPLAVLVLAAENTQAYGVLLSQGYRPPINAMTVASGVGGLLAPLTGGHNANVAGPMTAICSGPQAGSNPDARSAASVVNDVLFIIFGVLAGFAVTAVTALPAELVAVVAGLTMIGVLVSSFRSAFGDGRFRTGALAALVVAMSGIAPLGISSPFWALAVGVAISAVLEPGDFRTRAAAA